MFVVVVVVVGLCVCLKQKKREADKQTNPQKQANKHTNKSTTEQIMVNWRGVPWTPAGLGAVHGTMTVAFLVIHVMTVLRYFDQV